MLDQGVIIVDDTVTFNEEVILGAEFVDIFKRNDFKGKDSFNYSQVDLIGNCGCSQSAKDLYLDADFFC